MDTYLDDPNEAHHVVQYESVEDYLIIMNLPARAGGRKSWADHRALAYNALALKIKIRVYKMNSNNGVDRIQEEDGIENGSVVNFV